MDRIIKRVDFPKIMLPQALRVCAYIRVSSGNDAMLHSLSAQISHYSELIQSHTGWVYCGVYSDEALTGTKNDRDGFQQRLVDCRNGKIDMVITKSNSRFARNTVTLLETVRELKSLGTRAVMSFIRCSPSIASYSNYTRAAKRTRLEFFAKMW